jgi:hypothetical protein
LLLSKLFEELKIMTKSQSSYSVARLIAKKEGADSRQGTAFLVGRKHLITCRHCVPSADWRVHASFQQYDGMEDKTVACHPVLYHPSYDLAVLEIEGVILPDDLPGLRLGIIPSNKGAEWKTFGYPAADVSGRDIAGTIVNLKHRRDGNVFISLVSAQGAGDKLSGMSGSPLLHDDHVIGILCNSTELDGAYAIPISAVQSLIRDLALATEAWGERCSLSEPNFDDGRQYERVEFSAGNEPSTLRYLLVNVKNDRMDDLKRQLGLLVSSGKYGAIRQALVWSLLGSRELLFSLRTDGEDQAQYLINQLLNCTGVEKDEAEDIQISDEYTKADSGRRFVRSVAQVRPGEIYQYKAYRSIKAFIYLQTSKSFTIETQEKYLSKVKERILPFARSVDVIATSADRKYTIIELQLPCGQFDDLNSITATMEDGFHRSDFSKTTFIAYQCDKLALNSRGARA